MQKSRFLKMSVCPYPSLAPKPFNVFLPNSQQTCILNQNIGSRYYLESTFIFLNNTSKRSVFNFVQINGLNVIFILVPKIGLRILYNLRYDQFSKMCLQHFSTVYNKLQFLQTSSSSIQTNLVK